MSHHLPSTDQIWDRVLARIDSVDPATDFDRLVFHGLNALAVHRWHATGTPTADAHTDHGRQSLMQTMASEAALESIAELSPEPVVAFKGLEVATRYPYRGSRPFGDLDLISAAPDALHRLLQDHGWTQGRDHESYAERHHHLAALRHDDLRVTLEIHRHPGWEIWMDPPTPADLVAKARPIAGLGPACLGLHPSHNVAAVLVHAWRGNRFANLRDLLDVALIANDADRHELDADLDRYGIGRLWRAALRLIDWQFGSGAAPPRQLRLLAPNLADLDTAKAEPIRRMMGLLWVAPLRQAPQIMWREGRARRMIHIREDQPHG